MTLKSTLVAATAAIAFAIPALAADTIAVHDSYARSSTATSSSGAAFMMIENTGDTDDRLVSAASDIAARVELHTHKENADGVMQMMEVEEGFVIPAGGKHMLQRGGDHVMFMGLKAPLEQGATVPVTLTFEKAGEMSIDVPVDLERAPAKMSH
ncbi:copper chaperone PCu(A)C [Pukyongiella litopenaei]|uniref:Copper chaperone PCu(A)C n=1 Tax=Pukyongiella litopenaei TaxID=2605946 RepID=A0A2S0MSM8_9RHOB|nr:copper chaperone PCu(A)C [Pukyongiella litopenaei]AVO38741.1 copper chaperone PCu(A)C [Pukyongiella litopenaei]